MESTSKNIIATVNEPGTYGGRCIATANGLSTEKVFQFTVKPDLTPIPGLSIPDGPHGYASLEGVVTGGAAGPLNQVRNYDEYRDLLLLSTPQQIELIQTIKGTSATSKYGFYAKGGNKTIFAKKPGIKILGVGTWYWPDANKDEKFNNIIIRNIEMDQMPVFDPSTSKNNKDFFTFKGVGARKVWLDHMIFRANWPDGKNGLDGAVDITEGADLVTISNSQFIGINKATLVGGSTGARVTYLGNWFHRCFERQSENGMGWVDMVNNYYTNDRILSSAYKGYCMGANGISQTRARKNYFDTSCNQPPLYAIDDANGLYGQFSDINSNYFGGSKASNFRGRPEGTFVPAYDSTQFELANVMDVKPYVMANSGNILTL